MRKTTVTSAKRTRRSVSEEERTSTGTYVLVVYRVCLSWANDIACL